MQILTKGKKSEPIACCFDENWAFLLPHGGLVFVCSCYHLRCPSRGILKTCMSYIRLSNCLPSLYLWSAPLKNTCEGSFLYEIWAQSLVLFCYWHSLQVFFNQLHLVIQTLTFRHADDLAGACIRLC